MRTHLEYLFFMINYFGQVHNKDVKVDKTCQVCQVSIRSLTDYKRHIAMNHKFDCVCELKVISLIASAN